MYYSGFTYHEAKFLPVNLRRFFIQETASEIQRQNGETPKEDRDKRLSPADKKFLANRTMQANADAKKSQPSISESKALHHNTPEIRAYQNKERTNLPSRLMRFNGP